MDANEVRRAVTLDPRWAGEARAAWLALMDLCVFGDVKSSRLGALTRLRRRALDTGERLRSMTAARDWIPHPREQLKSALASALSLRESLQQLAAAARDVDGGGGRDELARCLARLEELASALAPLENAWAALLDAQLRDARDRAPARDAEQD
jgi:hypothetical protein